MGYDRELEIAIESLKAMNRRGIRICIGGDYGLPGRARHQRRDIQNFVRYLGFTPMEALLAATKYGAEIMMMGNELGHDREGYLADLLLIDGDPLANVTILQDPAILAVMKDGRFHKEPKLNQQRLRMTA